VVLVKLRALDVELADLLTRAARGLEQDGRA